MTAHTCILHCLNIFLEQLAGSRSPLSTKRYSDSRQRFGLESNIHSYESVENGTSIHHMRHYRLPDLPSHVMAGGTMEQVWQESERSRYGRLRAVIGSLANLSHPGSGSFIQLEVHRPVRGLATRVQRQPSISFQAPVKRTSLHSIMSKTKQHWRSTYCETRTLLCLRAGSQNLFSIPENDRSFPLLNRSVCGQEHGHLLTGLCFQVPSLTSSGTVP